MGRFIVAVLRISLLAVALVSPRAAFALDEPKLHATDPKLDAFDAEKSGQQGPTANPDATKIAYEPLDYEIDNWNKFVAQAQQEIDALKNSTQPGAAATVQNLTQKIAVARQHLAALDATKRLRQESKNCGLEAARQAWDDLKTAVEEEQKNVEPAAAAMERPMPPMPDTDSAAAEGMMLDNMKAMMHRVLEQDRENLEIINSNIAQIDDACAQAKRNKDLQTFKDNLEAGNELAAHQFEQAKAVAARGQFSDAKALAKAIGSIAQVARANQLLGNEELGQKQQQYMTDLFQDWLTPAVANCKDQTFDPEIAVSASRTAQLLGVSIPGTGEADNVLDACRPRLFAASSIVAGVPYHLRHCGWDVSGVWKLRIANRHSKIDGEGTASKVLEAKSVDPIEMHGSQHTYGTAPADIAAKGTFQVEGYQPTQMSVHGQFWFDITVDTANGLERGKSIMMHTNMTMEPVRTTESGPLPVTGTYPGATQGLDTPVMVVDGNKPCDPSADVWSYPVAP